MLSYYVHWSLLSNKIRVSPAISILRLAQESFSIFRAATMRLVLEGSILVGLASVGILHFQSPTIRLALGSSIFAGLVFVGVLQFRARYYPDSDCTQDPPISLGNHTWRSCDLYCIEYEDARDKFRKAVQDLDDSINVEYFTFTVVDDLTIDIVVLKGTREGVIIHSSATHGVEGYAGSAIQIAFLQLLQQHPMPDRPTIVLVHAVNPYGMKHYRRVNENNVDLNRNCIANFEDFRQSRHPNIAGYDSLRNFVSPTRAPTSWDTGLGWWLSSLPILLILFKNGYTQLKQVLVTGQYHHPTGVFYGGTRLQPSIEIIEKFMIEQGFLQGEVFWIDVHTGLGKLGKDTLDFGETRLTQLELGNYFPTAEHIVTPNVQDKKALSGYDLARGVLRAYFQEKYPGGLYVLQEFGTIPGILVGRALILENMMYQHGNDKASGRSLLQKAFYPQSAEWRASLVQRGVSLLLQAIEMLKTK